MSGYTPASTSCPECGGAVFPHSANTLTLKRDGAWVDIHALCPESL